MSSSGCRLSPAARVNAAALEQAQTESRERRAGLNFHKLPKELSTRDERLSRHSPSQSLPGTISARHRTESATPFRSRANHVGLRLSLGTVLFMSSLVAQLLAISFALRPNTWPRPGPPARGDRARQSNLLTWSSSSSDSERAEMIPSARYVYTYPNDEARKRARAPTTSTWNGAKIHHLHDQLNQLKRELDQELRRAPQEAEEAETTEVETREGGAKRPPIGGRLRLGSPCLSTQFCQKSIKNSHCDLERFTCECLGEHVKLNSTTCLAPALLGFECQLDDQCRRRVANSVCRSGKCACQGENSLAYKRNKCLKASKLNDYCLLDGQCQLNDRHSFCRWKIQNVYGTCKCPPNYKLATDQSNELRCAPRLGDSCLSDLECRLATENSVCGHSESFASRRKWSSSSASNRSCTCDLAFRWSDDLLRCLPAELEVPNVINVTSVDTLSVQQVSDTRQDSHKYELLEANSTATNGAQMDNRKGTNGLGELEIVKLVPMDASEAKQAASTTSKTTTTNKPALNESQLEPTRTTLRMVSLGKACKWRQECQARDPNSDCIEGVCECLAPSSRCRASARGCHPNTFQCRSGQCISWYFVCDQFRNCDDGSDEDDCRPGYCPREAFQCRADGQCLTRGRVCDGQRDCSDGSDEFGCGGASYSNGTDGNNGPSKCPAEAFACANGQCLPGYVFCNAVEDCADGSDEDELICERTSALTRLATNHNQTAAAAAAPDSSQPAGSGEQTRARAPARRNETIEAESPLVKTDRASIERLMAALGLSGGKWRPKAAVANGQTSRRSRLMSRPLEERRRPTQAQTRRQQHLVKNQRQGHGTEPLECPADGFTCRNGKCRSSAILCSGIDGCGDNSDEDNCEVCQCEPAPPSRATNSRRHTSWLT